MAFTGFFSSPLNSCSVNFSDFFRNFLSPYDHKLGFFCTEINSFQRLFSRNSQLKILFFFFWHFWTNIFHNFLPFEGQIQIVFEFFAESFRLFSQLCRKVWSLLLAELTRNKLLQKSI